MEKLFFPQERQIKPSFLSICTYRIHETLQPQNALFTVERICMRNLILLIPGFYADAQGHLYLDMGRFLREHDMPDVPEMRCLVWHEIGCIFGELKVIEITN